MRRLKVLISAYACEPGKGSEPGVGWNVAREMAKFHDIWVLTRSNNRPAIEAELARKPVLRLHFVYYDLPRWLRFWKKGQRGVQLYYYLWQIGAYFVAKRLHRQLRFDLVHHVTFVKYWAPSLLSLLPVPFVWGPVGGGESAPMAFWSGFGPRGILYEFLRSVARWLGERDPFVRLTARRASLALATTTETAARMERLGARRVEVFSQVGLPLEEFHALGNKTFGKPNPLRFISIGRLLHWKGLHLGLAAFAQSGLEHAEYWIIGNGPEKRRLERLAEKLGISNRVRFFGNLPRNEVLCRLAECHVLVHPSLHDSGGWVCLEAMAAGRAVICLDLGGPAEQVTEETGIKVRAETPDQAVRDLAQAMRLLAEDNERRQQMSEAARRRVMEVFLWRNKADRIHQIYVYAACGGNSFEHR